MSHRSYSSHFIAAILAIAFSATLAPGQTNVQRVGGAGADKYDTTTSVAVPTGKTLKVADAPAASTDVANKAAVDAAVLVETNRATAAEALKAPLASPSFTGTLTHTGNAVTITTATDQDVQIISGGTFNVSASDGATFPANTTIGDVMASEIGYLSGVTSGIQSQLNGKLGTTGDGSGLTNVNAATLQTYTPATLPVSTATQTGLDLKANAASPAFTGQITQSRTATSWGTGTLADPGDSRRAYIGNVVTTGGGIAPNVLTLKLFDADAFADIFAYNDGSNACIGQAIRSGGVWRQMNKIQGDTGRMFIYGGIQAQSNFGEHTLIAPADGSGDNVLALQNLASNHYSAVRFLSTAGSEVGAVGFGNSASLQVFRDANYFESYGGLYDFRVVMDASKGTALCVEASTGNLQLFADSGADTVAKGTKVFEVTRAEGHLTATGTGTFDTEVKVSHASTDAYFTADGDSGQTKWVKFKTGGLMRWGVVNTSSDNFAISRWDNAGAFVADALAIDRTTGVVSAPAGFSGSLAGTASTATALATARTINGVGFDGTANIVVPPPTSYTAVASGTAYTLTGSFADVDFGTTDPTITISTAGNYLLTVDCSSALNAATTVAGQTVDIILRRTNNTPADIGTMRSQPLPPATASTQAGPAGSIASFPYTATAGDIVTVQARITGTLGAGTVTIENAHIVAVPR